MKEKNEYEALTPSECVEEMQDEIARLDRSVSSPHVIVNGNVVCVRYTEITSTKGKTTRPISNYYFLPSEDEAALFAYATCDALYDKAMSFIEDARQANSFLAVTVDFLIAQVPVWVNDRELNNRHFGKADIAFSQQSVYFLFHQFMDQIIEVGEKTLCTDERYAKP